MAVTIDSVVMSIFREQRLNTSIRANNLHITTPKVYMEIPINKDIIEIPMFAFYAFRAEVEKEQPSDTIVAELYSCGATSRYKSLEAVMKECLSASFSSSLLVKVNIPNSVDTYYCTYGAVFNSRLEPLMMMSWVLEKENVFTDSYRYYYKRAIIRIDPGVFVSKEDAVQRFIAGKLLVSTINNPVYTPHCDGIRIPTGNTVNTRIVKAEIDKCPFIIKKVENPSISVTNRDLLKVAAEHIDELVIV